MKFNQHQQNKQISTTPTSKSGFLFELFFGNTVPAFISFLIIFWAATLTYFAIINNWQEVKCFASVLYQYLTMGNVMVFDRC